MVRMSKLGYFVDPDQSLTGSVIVVIDQDVNVYI